MTGEPSEEVCDQLEHILSGSAIMTVRNHACDLSSMQNNVFNQLISRMLLKSLVWTNLVLSSSLLPWIHFFCLPPIMDFFQMSEEEKRLVFQHRIYCSTKPEASIFGCQKWLTFNTIRSLMLCDCEKQNFFVPKLNQGLKSGWLCILSLQVVLVFPRFRRQEPDSYVLVSIHVFQKMENFYLTRCARYTGLLGWHFVFLCMCRLILVNVTGGLFPLVTVFFACFCVQALSKFLLAVNWADLKEASEAHRLIPKWAAISPEVSMCIL